MDKLARIAEIGQEFIKHHPYLSGFAAFFGIAILILRKMHYKLVVHPNIGGRHNNENPYGYRHPREKGLDTEDIEINVKEQTLRGWHIKHNSPQCLIVYYHQNAGNIGGRIYFIKELQKKIKANVLLVAYRGFSDSDGEAKPDEKSIMTDAAAILEKGIELSKRDELPLVVFGRSLGGSASIQTLSRPEFKYAAKALILENTFTSIFDVANNFIPIPFRFFTPLLFAVTYGSYNSFSKIGNVHVPILFIKGCKDNLIPIWQMDKLQKAHTDLKREFMQLRIPDGGHNDTWVQGGDFYFDNVRQFIKLHASL